MSEVRGRTAFITGGASGIGLGMAKVFLEAGMNVAIADLRQDHRETARAELRDADLLDRTCFIDLDVTDREAFVRAADEAEAAFGRIHVLCNNAGIGILKPIGAADYADWDWAIDVNLNGVFNGVRTILPRIRAHGEGGHIVNTASMAGILQYSQAGLYVTTKFAVVGFSEALRAELAPDGIGVTAFCPGGVRSNIREYESTRPERYAARTDRSEDGPPPRLEVAPEDRERLSRLTASPEEAGRLVLNGIRENALYVFTAPEFRPGVEERFEAIRRALGRDDEREKDALELIPGLIGSPIYREASRQQEREKS
ncbi:SDR family NAD(P)-dependent oxidoreductase [Altererythrobacter soli]|uniref:SDR family NAD(P)-dependent oxidoreductase n=1 Tax=Croceibacterium soli TaxID=1739690 RepID=A0A6I4UUC1_9SPHN|nr:SDR family NAD(P)-dependent oxidoreductase [Croceibacterium soli]MXP41123.1 SDR family NAD(P)-dependent oxidoreductase [Croceibacterium soli]